MFGAGYRRVIGRGQAHTQPIRALAILPAGQIVTGGEDSQVVLWRMGIGDEEPKRPASISKIRGPSGREARYFKPY